MCLILRLRRQRSKGSSMELFEHSKIRLSKMSLGHRMKYWEAKSLL